MIKLHSVIESVSLPLPLELQDQVMYHLQSLEAYKPLQVYLSNLGPRNFGIVTVPLHTREPLFHLW